MKTERNDMGINRKTIVFLIILLILVIIIVWKYGWYNQTPFEFSNPSDVWVTVEDGALKREDGAFKRIELTETERTKFLLFLEELKVRRTSYKISRIETNITYYISITGKGAGENIPITIYLNKEDLNKSYIVDRNKTYKLTKLQSEELLKFVIDFSNS